MLEKFVKKIHSDKGLTGADVAVSIAIIVLTIAVVSAVYVNATNKSKEEIRYSAATRIATQIIENIESMTYDEVVYRCDNYNSVDEDEEGYTFNVSVPSGYSAEVTSSKLNDTDLDVVRDITVNVTYTISGASKAITLYTVKEKELLEQTNNPNINLIEDYDSSNYYAIKYTSSGYMVTVTSDSDWYNYDEGAYALIYYSSTSYDYGDIIKTGSVESGSVYIWVPRYGLDSESKLAYCYGTSDYKISFSLYNDVVYSYMLTGSSSGETYAVDSISSYVSGTFEENDGLSGVWYQPNGTNETEVETAYNTLNEYVTISNF